MELTSEINVDKVYSLLSELLLRVSCLEKMCFEKKLFSEQELVNKMNLAIKELNNQINKNLKENNESVIFSS